MNRAKNYIVIIILFFMLGGQSVLATKMYRWIDEQGNVRYSDQIPPDQVKYRRETLNKNARVVDIIDKEKTKDQRDLEKRLLILRKQQDHIIAKQKAHDKVLLSTFRNLKDMKMALKGKMLALDGQIKVVQGNLNRIKKQLQDQQKKAAQHERDGEKVPRVLMDIIASSKEQIRLVYVEISKQFEKKRKVSEGFEEDLVRFAYLTQSKLETNDLSQKTAEMKAANELGLFICDSAKFCEQAWLAAKRFVYTYSTTDLDIESNKLIMSLSPYKDTDLSLSVSKMDMKHNKQQLFLDIRCRQSSLGQELCNGNKAKRIRQSFSGFIKSVLDAEMK